MPYEMVYPKTVIVTRHAGLVEFLREEGLIDESATVIPHATRDDVKGCRVVGILPLNLAACAACVEQPILILPPELRGKELSCAEVREHFAGMECFVVATPHELERDLEYSNQNGHQGYGRVIGKWEPQQKLVGFPQSNFHPEP